MERGRMRSGVERRQFRRAEVDVPVAIRPVSPDEQPANSLITGQVKNVSLAGVYCYAKAPCPLKTGERVACSIVIPPEQTRAFPFARLVGDGWVVRVEPVPAGRRAGENPTDEQVLGLAVAFTPDVTALGTIVH